MYYEKKKYERQIEESLLFQLNPETERNSYQRERYKMINDLYCYLMAINCSRYEPYGCEITEVANRCIDSFDSEKGAFLHYFNSAWKAEYAHICVKELTDMKYHGMKLSDADQRSVRRYLFYCTKQNIVRPSEEAFAAISEAMGISVENVRRIAYLNDLYFSDTIVSSEEGTEMSLWETVSDGHATIEAILEDAEAANELLQKIDLKFLQLQERQKPIVSDMMTIKVCPYITEGQADRFKFISLRIWEIWSSGRALPTQREIADKYGRNEASISRTVRNFIQRL